MDPMGMAIWSLGGLGKVTPDDIDAAEMITIRPKSILWVYGL